MAGNREMRNPLKLRAVLVDLNGTLHVGDTVTPGAARAVERLRASQFPLVFCSNNTKESTANLLGKLTRFGFPAEKNELLTSLGACRQLVEQRGLKPFLVMSPSAKEEFANLPRNDDPYDSVILGLHGPSLAYADLNTAFRILKGEPLLHSAAKPAREPTMIAPHTGMYHQAAGTDELPAGLSLGIGPFVRALEEAAGVKAEIVGKPTRKFFELALERLKREHAGLDEVRMDEVGIIGDDIINDLGGGAQELGLKRILVRTGKYRVGAEETDHPPDAVYDSFAAFVDTIM